MEGISMFSGHKKRGWVGLIFAIIVTMTFAGVIHGEEYGDGGKKWPGYYPDTFDGTGRITRFEGNEIVIDDTGYLLSPGITFNTTNMRGAPRTWFKNGQVVGFIKSGPREIIALYLLK